MARSETLELLDRTNWETTPLGPRALWNPALANAARLALHSPVAMTLLAGRDGVLIYNDGYAAIAGRRHPETFGMSALAAWPEVADFNRSVIERVFAGETLSYDNQKMSLHRGDVPEDVWFNLDYSPIFNEDGKVVAAFAIVVEITRQVKAEEDLALSREQLSLAMGASTIVGTWDWHVREDRVYSDAKFALLYGVSPAIAASGTSISDFTAAIHPDDVTPVGAAMAKAMETGEKFTAEYRLIQTDGTVRWVLAEGQPLLDETGVCVRFPGISVDITAQKRTAEAFAVSETAFRTLADAMPQMVWSTLPDGFHDYYNARWYEFTGMPVGSTDGEAWNGMFHEEDRTLAWEHWRHSLATGDPYQIEYRLRHHSGQYRWVLGRALAVRDEKGAISRWYGTCTDIHDARMIQAEREIVAHELSHRIKNIFSVLGGIIAMSARTAPQARDFAEQLRKRIDAMGRAHDFVRPHSKSSRPVDLETTVFGLLERLLEPYSDETGESRIAITGDDSVMGDGAATPLALLLHELGTNSTKYGALSQPDGHLAIHGRLDGEVYRLEWKESMQHVAPIGTPVDGFGSRLMKISVEGQLGGTFSRMWQDDGMKVDVAVPVSAITRSSRLGGRLA